MMIMFRVMINSNLTLANIEVQFQSFDSFVHFDRQFANDKRCWLRNQFLRFWKEIFINRSEILRLCRKLWFWINLNCIIVDIFITLALNSSLFKYSFLISAVYSWKTCSLLSKVCRICLFSKTIRSERNSWR
jgi:cellulose synthase/poly-beta-1,6-N-acetylglucosamine synthase-like glycosyltransferase